VGHTSTFTVTTSHSYPTPTLSESGALPGGVTFTDNHDGTATLSGTPAAGSQGSYPLTITADNGVSPAASQGTSPSAPASASQSFTLTVSGPTIAVVKSFTAKRSGSRVAFRWHLVQKATIAGFNLYAGKHKLNKSLIKVHSKMTYNYHVTWTKHSHFVLDVLLTDGAHLSIPSQ
jgi:hypothetical protein